MKYLPHALAFVAGAAVAATAIILTGRPRLGKLSVLP